MRQTDRPIIKALGDDTRFRIYSWLDERADAATTAEIADHFGIHPNTVRPHLDRLREAGLVDLDTASTGSVGRPQHRYRSVEADIERSGGEALAVFATMLADVCCDRGGGDGVIRSVGETVGREMAAGIEGSSSEVLCAEMTRLGFAPTVGERSVVFNNCPLSDLAQSHPELICTLHESMVDGMLDAAGGRLQCFHDRESSTEPCTAGFE